MINFQYARANDVGDAVRMIATDPTAKFIVGGTNLIDLTKEDVERPSRLSTSRGCLKTVEETVRATCLRWHLANQFNNDAMLPQVPATTVMKRRQQRCGAQEPVSGTGWRTWECTHGFARQFAPEAGIGPERATPSVRCSPSL